MSHEDQTPSGLVLRLRLAEGLFAQPLHPLFVVVLHLHGLYIWCSPRQDITPVTGARQRPPQRLPASLPSSLLKGSPRHRMSTFHDRINARREALQLTYEGVHQRLLEWEWPEGTASPALPTVGHWFNGTRRPRDMEHMRALCAVLDMRIDEAVNGVAVATNSVEDTMVAMLRDMPDNDQELALMLVATLKNRRQ